MPYSKFAKHIRTIIIAVMMISLLSCARSATKIEPFEHPSSYPSEIKPGDIPTDATTGGKIDGKEAKTQIIEPFKHPSSYPSEKKFEDLLTEAVLSGENKGEKAKPQTVETSGEITVGAILPLSGPYREYGEKVLRSLMLAGNFFEGGQEKDSVTLLLEDSVSDSEKARQSLTKLAARPDLAAVIGPLSSEESLSAAREAQKQGVPLLTLTRNEAVTSAGKYIFNALPSFRTQMNRLARYTLEKRGLKRIAVLYPDVPSGRDAAETFRDEVKKEGGRVTHYVAYDQNDTDFSAEIGTLIGKRLDMENKENDARKIVHKIGFDALFIPDSALRVAQILSQLSFYNVRGFQLLGQCGMNDPDTLMTHRELFEGTIFVDGYFPDGSTPQSDEFADRFYEAYEREADTLEAYAYDAMRILATHLRNHPGITRGQLREDMAGLTGEGVRGKIEVNSSGVMDSEPILITITDGYPVRIMTQ